MKWQKQYILSFFSLFIIFILGCQRDNGISENQLSSYSFSTPDSLVSTIKTELRYFNKKIPENISLPFFMDVSARQVFAKILADGYLDTALNSLKVTSFNFVMRKDDVPPKSSFEFFSKFSVLIIPDEHANSSDMSVPGDYKKKQDSIAGFIRKNDYRLCFAEHDKNVCWQEYFKGYKKDALRWNLPVFDSSQVAGMFLMYKAWWTNFVYDTGVVVIGLDYMDLNLAVQTISYLLDNVKLDPSLSARLLRTRNLIAFNLRESVVVYRVMKEMSSRDERRAVLVFGALHKDRFKELLKGYGFDVSSL